MTYPLSEQHLRTIDELVHRCRSALQELSSAPHVSALVNEAVHTPDQRQATARLEDAKKEALLTGDEALDRAVDRIISSFTQLHAMFATDVWRRSKAYEVFIGGVNA